MFKVGIVGLGSIGFRHLKNILREISVKKIYIFDVNQKSCIVKLKELDDTRVQLVKSIEKILEAKVDIVFICSPNIFHFEHALEFAKIGIPLFIEKPVTISFKECSILNKLARSFIFVGCNMRYHPAIKEARKLLSQKFLGKIVSSHAFFGHNLKNWRPGMDYRNTYSAKSELGGGILLDGVHEIDYIIWLFGEIKIGYCCYFNSKILEIDTEDIAKIVLFHKNGIVSSISLDYIQPVKRRGLEIVGSEGVFLWESRGKTPEFMRIELLTKNEKKILIKGYFNDPNICYLEEIKEIFDVLNGKNINNTSLLTINKACKTIEIINAFKEKGYYERTISL